MTTAIAYRRRFIEHILVCGYSRGWKAWNIFRALVKCRDFSGRAPWEHYGHFADSRAERARLLGPGERWLTPADRIQAGDKYLAQPSKARGFFKGSDGEGWWEFMGPKSSMALGEVIPLDVFCYTPKGKIIRT